MSTKLAAQPRAAAGSFLGEPAAPPYDFARFVAERRSIAVEDAEALIASWLADYQPRAASRRGELSASPG